MPKRGNRKRETDAETLTAHPPSGPIYYSSCTPPVRCPLTSDIVPVRRWQSIQLSVVQNTWTNIPAPRFFTEDKGLSKHKFMHIHKMYVYTEPVTGVGAVHALQVQPYNQSVGQDSNAGGPKLYEEAVQLNSRAAVGYCPNPGSFYSGPIKNSEDWTVCSVNSNSAYLDFFLDATFI